MNFYTSFSEFEAAGSCENHRLINIFPRPWDSLKLEEKCAATSTNYCFPEKCLSVILQPEYWTNRTQSVTKSSTYLTVSCNTADHSRHELTEYQIVREILWALQGSTTSIIFSFTLDSVSLRNNRVIVSRQASLLGASDQALDHILKKFADFCTLTSIVRIFACQLCMQQSIHPCAYAFASSLSEFLTLFDKDLASMQMRSRGPDLITVYGIHSELLPWLRRFSLLVRFIMQLTDGDFQSCLNSTFYIRLLDILYYFSTDYLDCINDNLMKRFLSSTFFSVALPYLHSTFDLLSGVASTNECFESCFVDSDTGCPSSHQELWCRTSLTSPRPIPKIMCCASTELFTCFKTLSMIVAIVNDFRCPQILQSVIQKESILQILFESCPFYAKHVYHKGSLLDVDSETTSNLSDISCRDARGENICSFLTVQDEIKRLPGTLKEIISHRSKYLSRQLLNILLRPPLTCSDFSLGDALSAVVAVFLFGTGDLMNDFARSVFYRAKSCDLWYDDILGLSRCLHDYFSLPTSPAFLKRLHSSFLFVKTSSGSSADISRFHPFNLFKIEFQTKWPVNIVLTQDALDKYNKVFVFLFKVKYVKWTLENLRFTQVHWLNDSHPNIYHRALLVRLNLLCIFSALHDFLSHRIEGVRLHFVNTWGLSDVGRTNVDFAVPESENTASLGHLIDTHNDLLSKIQSICLLTPSHETVAQGINALCQLTLKFQSLWIQNSEQHSSIEEFLQLIHCLKTHVTFLARVYRSLRLSHVEDMFPLIDTFVSASRCIGLL